MTDSNNIICFDGCKPDPIASYLKGLGIFRIIAEQLDSSVRCRWKHERMELETKLTREDIRQFFLCSYNPAPITTPWNGASGYFPNDKGARNNGLVPLKKSRSDRFLAYRQIIQFCEDTLQLLGLAEKPDKRDSKLKLLKSLRAECPDVYLDWLDAAIVLTEAASSYPPLLGTGGNDGHLDFSSAYMQRLVSMFDLNTGKPMNLTDDYLDAALFETVSPKLQKASIGQFYPGARGGFNSSAGFSGDGVINPWDYVLLIEGSLLFTAAAHKRMDAGQPGVPAAPFTVQNSPAGYGSSTPDEVSNRGEVWVPLWSKWTSVMALKHLFGEGRVTVGRRKAATGIDFARAVKGLGVAAGIDAFHRFGIQERFGDSNLAVSLGRWNVKQNRAVQLLDEIDPWLSQLRNVCRNDKTPGRIVRAWNMLEQSIMRFVRHADSDAGYELISALVGMSAVQSRAWKFCKDRFLSPPPMLSSQWINIIEQTTPEYLIGMAVGSIRKTDSAPAFREHIEPVVQYGRACRWVKDDVPAHVVYKTNNPVTALTETALRRFMDAVRHNCLPLPVDSGITCPAWALEDFLANRIDSERLNIMIRFGSMVRWQKDDVKDRQVPDKPFYGLPAAYTILKLCHLPFRLEGHDIVHDPSISALLYAGNLSDAATVAVRRLRISGLPPRVTHVPNHGELAQRCLAALLVPVTWHDLQKLVNRDILPDLNDHEGKMLLERKYESTLR
jgi:CRISPR-associated protein Csx17